MEEVKEKMGELDSSGTGIGAQVRKKEEEVYKVGFCRMGCQADTLDWHIHSYWLDHPTRGCWVGFPLICKLGC